MAFKPPLQPQLPAVQLEKPQAVSSAPVKPTPTCQTQLNVAGHRDSPFNTTMVSTQSKVCFIVSYLRVSEMATTTVMCHKEIMSLVQMMKNNHASCVQTKEHDL